MDIFDLCNHLKNQSMDMILCDLPYGVTECAWDKQIPIEPMWETFKRILKPHGVIALTATQPFSSKLVMSNLEWFKYEWVWVNYSRPTMFIHAKNCPLRVHENVLIFSQGVINHKNCTDNRMNYFPQMDIGKPYRRNNTLRKLSSVVGKRPSHREFLHINDGERYPKDVLEINESNNSLNHPSQKPIALFEYLILTYTQPGDVVFDPCVGSGTTALAARGCDRNYIVGDKDENFARITKERLAAPYTPKLIKD